MRVIDPSEIPIKETRDIDRIKEISAFEISGAEACEVERYAKDLSTDYNRYKSLLWKMQLSKKMKVFTRRGRVFIRLERSGQDES